MEQGEWRTYRFVLDYLHDSYELLSFFLSFKPQGTYEQRAETTRGGRETMITKRGKVVWVGELPGVEIKMKGNGHRGSGFI